MRFLSNLRQAYKVTYHKFCLISCANHQWDQLSTRSSSSFSSRNKKPRRRLKRNLTKQPRRYRSVTNQPPEEQTTYSSSISPVAIITNMEKTHKIALIPVNLYGEKMKNEVAFKEAMGIISLLKKNALDVNLFTDSCVDFKHHPTSESMHKLFTVQDFGVKLKKQKAIDDLSKFTDEKINAIEGIESLSNKKSETQELDDEIHKLQQQHQQQQKKQKLDVSFHLPTDIERDLKQIPVSGMDINFEMNMTNIKEAILNCNKFADLPFENKSLPNPTLSMSTNLRMNSGETKTIPLHFNAMIRGTVNIDPKEFSDEKLKSMRVCEFNEFVTAVSANICSTALQKGFRIDKNSGREKIEKETKILTVPSVLSEENKNVNKTEAITSYKPVSPELSSLFRKYDQMHDAAYQEPNYPNDMNEDDIIADLVNRYDNFKKELTAIEADALYPTNESLKEWISLPSSKIVEEKSPKPSAPAEKTKKLERDIKKKKRDYPVLKGYVTVDFDNTGHKKHLHYEKQAMVSAPLHPVNSAGLIAKGNVEDNLIGSMSEPDIASEIKKIKQNAFEKGAAIFVNELQVMVPKQNEVKNNIKEMKGNDDEVLGDNLNNTPKK